MRILLVEDDRDLGPAVAAALRAEHFAVDVATNGVDAAHLGETELYDAAVLDLGLPDLDGIGVLGKWRATGRDLPVLFALHRALTGATVLCIDISSAPLRSYSRVLSRADLSVVANQVGVPSDAFGRRRMVRPKEIKQTRKRVVITSNRGSFDETGLMLVTRAQYADIGCDAYLVTHPDWWAAHDATSTVATTRVASSILSSSIDADEEDMLTPEEREAEQRARPVRLAAALREGAAHIAMRRFADLLVPYMAAGREDATV